jgi:vitamin B12 transporter
MKYQLGIACAVLLAAAGQAAAEDIALDTILVTEGLTPVEQEKSGRAFTVITSQQLEQNQVRYVADALRQVPGFAVSRTGSSGGFTQVRVRGAEGNHLLVMVDGIDVSETSGGEFDFGSLQAADIERIEILRGPQSAFWGSNALAGVVNIITKGGIRNGYEVSGRSETGTDGTFLGGVSVRGGGEIYDLALSGSLRQNDGFNISEFGSEKDGDRNATLNGKFNIDVTPDFKLDATLRYVNRKSDTDAQSWMTGLVEDTDDQTATREFFGSVGATYVSLDGALTQKARFTGSDVYREYLAGGAVTSDNDGNRYNGTYQASYAFDTADFLNAKHQLTGGYEWERETFKPSHLDERFGRSTNSFIGEYRGEFLDQIYLNAALRRDLNDEFANATTYSLSGAWKIPGTATRLHSSVGTGVTNPTFFEQFGFTPDFFIGNPNLKPEESLGWDIGIEQGFFDGKLVADITYFNQDLKNEITTSFAGPLPTPINRDGKSKRHGVELSATLNLIDGLSTTATYTYTKATEQTFAGGPRVVEVRRPEHSGSLNVAYTFYKSRARVFGEAIFNGKMEDNAFVPGLPPRVTLDSYTVVNVGGSFKFNEHVEAYARVENLFDEQYQEVFGYNTAGRTAFVGLKGKF